MLLEWSQINVLCYLSIFFAAQMQIPIPNIYLGFGFKGLVFEKIIVDQWKTWKTHSTKLGADKSTESTPNAKKYKSAQIVCPSPKDWYFDEKRLH